MKVFQSEPAAAVAAITGTVAAILYLLVVFGIDVSTEQQAAILGAITAIFGLVTFVWTRSQVFAPDTHEAEVDKAFVAGASGDVKPVS